MDRDRFDELDAAEREVVLALAHDRGPATNSLSSPHAFICEDGRTYWVKRRSQCGLASELIAGRLAGKIQAGPEARIIQVPAAALPSDGSAAHLEGIGVGTLDCKGTVNSKELHALLAPNGSFDPGTVDAASRALAVTFNTWLGAIGDPQVLVDLSSGRVLAIDYGDCFCDVDSVTRPNVVVAAIPGVELDHGREWPLVEEAVVKVEELDDDMILEAVIGIPTENDWNADGDRRFKIAEWLVSRRDQLRAVMQAWAP